MRRHHEEGPGDPQHLEVANLSKAFGPVPVLKDVSLQCERGEFVSLLGPSGCGKTTLLRIIAGLERPDEGDVWIGGRRVTDQEPRHRGLAFIFQSYAMWPHLSVYDNIAYGLRVRRAGAARAKARVSEVADLLGIGELLDRYPDQLSGGQQQRVALARSLAYESELVLLDEPLSNLDEGVRVRARRFLRDVQQQLGVTAIYVTHNQEEALAMSDRVLVMRDGHVAQDGRPYDIYNFPRSHYVASLVGHTNVLRLAEDPNRDVADTGPCLATESGGPVRVTAGELRRSEELLRPGVRALAMYRPEDVTVCGETEEPPDANVWTGQVDDVQYVGNGYEVQVVVGDERLIMRLEKTASLGKGQHVRVCVPAETVRIIADDR